MTPVAVTFFDDSNGHALGRDVTCVRAGRPKSSGIGMYIQRNRWP